MRINKNEYNDLNSEYYRQTNVEFWMLGFMAEYMHTEDTSEASANDGNAQQC